MVQHNTYPFLKGGGKMAGLIRNHHWAQTPLGTPDAWPQALRISVSNMLNTCLPMLVLWGNDFACFYNDAVIPSLSPERHPAIGKPASEVWAEGWSFIGPLLQKVMATGEPVTFQDAPVPFYRNGQTEAMYWTFSYSLVLDDDGKPGGVLVTGIDTTANVTEHKQSAETEAKLRAIINSAPTAMGVFVGPDLIVENPNQFLIELMGAGPNIEGKSFRQLLSGLVTEDQKFIDLIDSVRTTGQPFEAQEVGVYFKAEEKTRYFNISFTPLRDESGGVYGVLDVSVDVTAQVAARHRLQEAESRFRSLIEEAPVPTALFVGRDMVIEVANKPVLNVWGKGDSVLGKPLAKVLPELEGQPFLKILDEIFTTGETFETKGAPAHLVVDGVLRTYYFDYTFKPLRNAAGEVYAIMDMAIDVTEQVLSRQKIEASQRSLLALFEESPVGIATLSADDALLFETANSFYGRLVGRTPEEIIGKPLLQALPEIKGQGFEEILKEVIATGKPYVANEAAVAILREGALQTIYVNLTYQPRKEGQTVTGVLVVATDVTEQVRSRKKIEESEQQVRSLIESAPFPIGVYTGQELKIIFANEAMMKTWGKGTDVVGRLYTELLPELAGQEIFEQLRGVVRSGIAYHAKNTRVDLVVDGTLQPFYFNYSFTPLYDAEGNVYGVMNTAADVTDLVNAHQKLAQSEKNLRGIVLQSPVAMCILTGPHFVVEVANEAMLHIWGKPVEQVANKPIFEGLPDAREQGLEKLISDVYHTGVSFKAAEHPVELLRNGKQETVYQNFVYEPYKDLEGKIQGVLAISIDVTPQVLARRRIEEVVAQRTKELATANESLSAVNKELQRSNANLEEFAHAASHDLKEPIRKITFFTTQLKDQLGARLQETELRSLGRIENASVRMGALIDDLLLYSHVSHRPHETEAIDLNQKVQKVLEDLELDVEEKRARINVGQLPVVQGYRRQLQQLFQNLISNALKYSKADVPPQIDISASQVEEAGKLYHVIEVADNGIGFEQEYEEKIFQMFARLHGKHEYSGTGVGLSIVKKVVENHNGFIRVKSEVGKGSVFSVYLPAR